MQYLGMLLAVAGASLVGSFVVQWMVLRMARFRPTFTSSYAAVFAAFLVSALLYQLMLKLGPLAGLENSAAALFVANLGGILFHACFYRWFLRGPNGERVRIPYAIGTALLLMTVGLGLLLLLGWIIAIATGGGFGF